MAIEKYTVVVFFKGGQPAPFKYRRVQSTKKLKAYCEMVTKKEVSHINLYDRFGQFVRQER